MGARLGQHFLKRPDVARRIVEAAALEPGGAVVEIGPGRGILTAALLAAGAAVTAVELDGRLASELHERFKEEARLRVIHADFLRLGFDQLPARATVAANLPYAVASPILQRLLGWPGCERAVLMFQREVAERILAAPGSRDYGVLTLSVALQARARRICDVPKECFTPRPAVDSAVVRLERGPMPLPEGLSEERLMAVIKAAFGQRRKQAANALAHALEVPRAAAESALASAGVDPQARAEEIGVDAFIALALRLPAPLGARGPQA